jgi:hypothetical protein
MAISPCCDELLASGVPWLPDTEDEYVSVFLGSSFSPSSGGSRLAAFIGGKLTFVRQSREETQTGFGIGVSPGVRWQLISAVGMEFMMDLSWMRLHGERTVILGPFPTGPKYRRTRRDTWETGYSIMLGVGLVLGLG